MVSFSKKTIENYDSMGGAQREVLKYVLDYVADEMKDKTKSVIDKKQWTLVSHGQRVPQQRNTDELWCLCQQVCRFYFARRDH